MFGKKPTDRIYWTTKSQHFEAMAKLWKRRGEPGKGMKKEQMLEEVKKILAAAALKKASGASSAGSQEEGEMDENEFDLPHFDIGGQWPSQYVTCSEAPSVALGRSKAPWGLRQAANGRLFVSNGETSKWVTSLFPQFLDQEKALACIIRSDRSLFIE